MRKRARRADLPSSPGTESRPTAGPTAGPTPGSTGPAAAAPQLLAGYRVVRRLGSSGRADVYLGHAGHGDTPEGAGRAAGVALKVFGAETDPASIEREIRALSETQAGRLPELLDVATLPDARVCLVLERLAGPPLSRYLGSIDRIEPGEAVTILAPIVTALSALHEAGFAHEGLSQSTVLFDGRGRPVVTGLGALGDLPPTGMARTPALRADYVRIGLLVRGVFDCLDPLGSAAPTADQLATWFEQASAVVPFRPCLHELEQRLFDWSPATAVRLRVAGLVGTGGVGADASRADLARAAFLSDATDRGQRGDTAAAQPEGRRLPGWFAVFHLPPELRQAAAALDGNAAARGMGRLRERVRRHRRPLVLAAVLGSALLLPALSLLPEWTGPEQGASGTGQTGGDRAGTRSSAPAHGGNTASPDAGDVAALAGDDPLLAVPVLLRLRAGCLAQASVLCLDGVDQPGSAIMTEDGYATRSAQQGGKRAPTSSFDGQAASLVERTGNSALVALAPSAGRAGADLRAASVLVVKGEAGWRLREIFDY